MQHIAKISLCCEVISFVKFAVERRKNPSPHKKITSRVTMYISNENQFKSGKFDPRYPNNPRVRNQTSAN